MTLPALPAQGSPSWYPWAEGIHEALDNPSANAALSAAFGWPDDIVGFDTLTHWQSAVAAVKAGTRDGKLLCLGDSTVAGVGLNSAHDQGLPGSWPDVLAAVLRSCGIPAALALGIPQPSGGDARWTGGVGWNLFGGSGFGFGNYSDAASNGATTPYMFRPGIWADRYDVTFLTNTTGLGDLTAVATGGGAVTVPTANGTVGIGKVTVSAAGPSLDNVVTVTPASSSGIHVLGVDPWLSTGRQVRVGNAGVGSSTAVQWAAAGNGPQWNATAAIKAYAPDLTIICLGVNDALASATSAAYLAAMNTIITAAKVSGDVVLLTPIPPTAAAPAEARLITPVLTEAMRGLGQPVADLQKHWGAGEVSQARGIMQDSLHPNAVGYAEIGRFLGVPLARATA